MRRNGQNLYLNLEPPPSPVTPSTPLLPRYNSEKKAESTGQRSQTFRIIAFGLAVIAVVLLVVEIAHSQGYTSKSVVSQVTTPLNHSSQPKTNLAANATTGVLPLDAYTLPGWVAKKAPITFIPYTYGYAMLVQTLRTYHRAGWKNIVVIDASWDHDAYNEEEELKKYGVLKVVATMTHMRFTQIQSTMDALANSLGHEYYMWGHSDVLFVSPQKKPFEQVKSCIEDRLVASPDLGVLMFNYDWLNMVRVSAANAAPWDPAMMQYGADCDRYSRMQRAGYRLVESKDAECTEMRSTLGTFFNMHGTLKDKELDVFLAPTTSYEDRLQLVLTAENNTVGNYTWRAGGKGTMGKADTVAHQAYEDAGFDYYQTKWGKKKPDGCDHGLHYDQPKFDIPAKGPALSPPPVRPASSSIEVKASATAKPFGSAKSSGSAKPLGSAMSSGSAQAKASPKPKRNQLSSRPIAQSKRGRRRLQDK